MLGINKTSESPPQLRRQHADEAAEATAQLFDARIRHTYANGNGAAGSSNFDRGAGYRSSLQNVHSNGGSTVSRRGCKIGFPV